jgi:hypothetical protein
MTMLEKIGMGLKKVGIAAAIVAALGGGVPKASAADGSVEFMTGHEVATLDLKVAEKLAPGMGLFVRGITSTSYDSGEVSPFCVVDISYDLGAGVGLVAEAQAAPGMGVVPRLGAQYFTELGDVTIYALGTVKAMESPDGEVIVDVRYTPKVAEGVELLLGGEALTHFSEKGHDFSTQKLRAGVRLGEKYEVGAGVDLLETGKDGILDYSAGGFAGLKF